MDHSEQTRRLENAPIRVLLWQYSIPAILGMVVNATYNIVGRIFIGQTIGEIGITAATLSFPAVMIFNAFGMLIGIGTSTIISIKLGEKKNGEAEQIIGQSLFLFALISLLFAVIGTLFLEPMLYLFGATAVSLPLAKEYLGLVLFGILFQTISFGVNSFIRAEGQPRVAMYSMLIGALSNIFFDWLFLVVLGTGIWGAALAMILAQALSSVWVLWLYFSGRTLLKIRFRYIRFDYRRIFQIASYGFPPFAMQIMGCVLQILQNHQLKYYGEIYGKIHGLENGAEISIAIMGILFSVFMLFLMPLLGLGQGMQPIVGYNIGNRRFDRVRQTLSFALLVGFLFSTLTFILVMLRPEWLILPFIKSNVPNRAEILSLGTHAVRVFSIMLPGVGLAIITISYFQSCGKPLLSLFLSMLRQVLLLVPLLLFLPYVFERIPGATGLDGIWYSTPISDLGAIILAVLLLIFEFKRLASGIE
ncbi:MAG: MATE family efflux transporter [Planctomycetaceae bacterium]|nr:MATE family efflux transporter [Planctomycetaceae bacterium]